MTPLDVYLSRFSNPMHATTSRKPTKLDGGCLLYRLPNKKDARNKSWNKK
jgi:hypothetical protein